MSVVSSLSVSNLLWVVASLLTFDPFVCILALKKHHGVISGSVMFTVTLCACLCSFSFCVWMCGVCVCVMYLFVCVCVCVCVCDWAAGSSQSGAADTSGGGSAGWPPLPFSLSPIRQSVFSGLPFYFRSVYVCLCVCTFYPYLPVASLIYQIESSWACFC